ncbi:hypothetical protein [Pseudanabaena sp. FACHB-2040]|uniref:hypothetical protein n=1 Tax=Pseudanabaena sp. FACHB-2040 TaxID=2692859 RepID=UPI0016845D70|nr:hypothetical protein [Pseudanabaena sp. FACHB-2040]MBD2257348.1 hypothetical protein [Pseudanabaena sp. FACHB-2040]
MTLPVGTALQKGSYIIDAFCFEDSLGPTYLATQVRTGQTQQIKILGARRPDQIPDQEVRSQFQSYLEQVNALNHPHIVQPITGFEEEGVFYLVMEAAIGQPLTARITPQTPLSAQTALQVLQQLKQTLETLRPLGWAGLTLAPDQLWLRQRRLLLTGFGFPPSGFEAAVPEEEVVAQLAQLLFFLLTGELAASVQAPAVHLRHRRPGLPVGFEAAVEQGLAPARTPQATLSLSAWMDLLPQLPASGANGQTAPLKLPEPAQNQTAAGSSPIPALAAAPVEDAALTDPTPTVPADAAEPILAAAVAAPKPVPAATESPAFDRAQFGKAQDNFAPAFSGSLAADPQTVAAKLPKRRPFWLTPQVGLVLTGLVASVAGLSFGLSLRLRAPAAPNSSRLNPEQAFPPLPDWGGDDPVAEFDTPYLPDDSVRRERPNDTPRRELPATEPIERPIERAPARRVAPPPVQEDYAEPPDQWESSPGSEDAIADPFTPAAEPPSMADPLPPVIQPSELPPTRDVPIPAAPPAPLLAPNSPAIEKSPPSDPAPSFSRSAGSAVAAPAPISSP